MKKSALLIALFFLLTRFYAQFLPNTMTDLDRAMMPDYVKNISPKGFITPPSSQVRNVAEWEEMDAIVLSWQSYPDHLTEIVRAAVEECQVYILTQNSSSVNSTLINAGVDVTNVHYINTPTNSVWIRDFGPNNIYTNDVDSLLFVDWIYNRPSRPDDDASPAAVASTMNIPLYETTQAPTDLVNTGGNYFTDGFGTAFATELILEENESGNPYGVTAKTEADIDTIMKHFMGIDRYVKFTVLPYDGIHHIDMHMKMLDEETLLVGEYPTGVADGPQIEANLQYLQNNFMSVFGTPYRIIRIPNPPSPSGLYPDNGGYYRTYTNSLIINKTIIVPTYYEEYDTTALRIYREAMPGYKIVGIDCDDNYGPIAASGAIHCITHEIAAQNPVLISHKRLEDTNNIWTPYQVDAKILNKSGIAGATVYYTTDTLQPFQAASMTFTDPLTNTWTGYIPAQPSGTRVYYYIEATSNNGKTMVRPMPAPNGWWTFKVDNPTDIEYYDDNIIKIISYYNQSENEICVFTQDDINCNISLYDILGKKINTIYQGTILKGKNTFPVKNNVNAGCYNLVLSSGDIRITKQIFLQ